VSGNSQAQDVRVAGPDGRTAGPDVYVIQRGDTLWDISFRFLGNPYYWPRLWSINDYVTNPHWIYPGNRIVFRPGTLLDPPRVNFEDKGGGYTVASLDFDASDPDCGPDIRFTDTYATSTFTSPGFMADKNDVEVYGEVYGAKSGMITLAEGDRVYLKLDNLDAVECGDVLAVYRRKGSKVRHPESRRVKYGYLHDVLAELTVLHTDKDNDTVTAMVRHSYNRFNRGDLVGPLFPVRAELQVSAPRGDLEGQIVALLDTDAILQDLNTTVFLDVGRSDGVLVGNSFWRIHRRDEAISLTVDDDELPEQVRGRLVVTRVQEDHSTAVLVDASAPVAVGDHVAMRID